MLTLDLIDCESVFRAHGRCCRGVESTHSTNDDLKTWVLNGAELGSVVIADTQQSGRGRQGRVWSSPKGETLAFSMVIKPHLASYELPSTSLVVGLAVQQVLNQRATGALIKWPNDIVYKEAKNPDNLRKIAGILIETAMSPRDADVLIVGVGINVARASFPPELQPIATSLLLEGARDLNRTQLALELAIAIEANVQRFVQNRAWLHERFGLFDALKGRSVCIAEQRGIANGIDSSGKLRILRTDGSAFFATAGEVSIAFDERIK